MTDFSAIDSLAKAQQRVEAGELVPFFLLPLEFGGAAVPQNIVYVPPWVEGTYEEKIYDVIQKLIAEGRAQRYAAEPSYQGASLVPSAITIRAWDPGSFETTIKIWG